MAEHTQRLERVPNPALERPDPEVPAKTRRRQFSAAYQQRILEEADRGTESGQSGALRRREGL
jgi:transposase